MKTREQIERRIKREKDLAYHVRKDYIEAYEQREMEKSKHYPSEDYIKIFTEKMEEAMRISREIETTIKTLEWMLEE